MAGDFSFWQQPQHAQLLGILTSTCTQVNKVMNPDASWYSWIPSSTRTYMIAIVGKSLGTGILNERSYERTM